MPELDLERYIPVHERIKQFREDHRGKGRIQTLVRYQDERFVRCKAHVYVREEDGWSLAATGHAEQERDSDTDNGFPVETCETSAVGRALAIMGYEIDRGIASRTEMEKVARKKSAKASGMKTASELMEPTEEHISAAARTVLQEKLEALANGVAPEQRAALAGAIKLQLRGMNVPTDSKEGWLGRALAHLTPAQAVELERFATQEGHEGS